MIVVVVVVEEVNTCPLGEVDGVCYSRRVCAREGA